MGEILRLIREEEPPRPSVRLSGSAGPRAMAAAYRKTASEKLPGLLRGDLDWIVMKALDKDRKRRFETASALAADVRRYLSEEPLDARPPSAAYRLRKFVSRYRGPVAAAAVVLLALVAGVIGTTWGMVSAVESEREAVAAREEEKRQRRTAEGESKRALRAEAEARSNAVKAWEKEKEAREATVEALLRGTLERTARNQAEWGLYASHIALAEREWEAHDFGLVDHYLNQCRPEFAGWEYEYLRTVTDRAVRTLEGHEVPVMSVAYSPDGALLASGEGRSSVPSGPDGKPLAGNIKSTVRLWDVVSGKVRWSSEFETLAVTGPAFSPNGRYTSRGHV